MAYQPKSYRKFLATSITATLVAGAFVAPASAASNFNDQIPNWADAAVDYLVGKGAIEGKPGNVFDPNGNLTRAEAAKILAIAVGLEIDEDAKTDFSDAENHWGSAYIAAIQDQLPGVIDGYNGQFRPNDSITRQELSKMVVEAYELEEDESANVAFSDNNGWGAEYVDALSSLGIVQGKGADRFAPNANVTRAETAVFVYRTEVPAARVLPESAVLAITSVEGLDDSNRFLSIQFSQRVANLEISDIEIQHSKSGERYGVKEVTLSNDGRTATVELFTREDNAEVLEYNVDYNVTVNADGKILTSVFNRPAFMDSRVVSIDVDNDRFTAISDRTGLSVTVKVPKDAEFDYYGALGERVYVWYNEDRELVNSEIVSQSATFDAIEIDRLDRIKVLSTGTNIDLSDDEYARGSGYKARVFVDGEEVRIDSDGKIVESSLISNKDRFNFAKIGYNSSGDIEFVSAYSLDEFLIVDRVDDNEVIGIEGDASGSFNAKDATIIKDGKIISLDDLEKGDVLFFSTTADDKDGFAEVISSTVTGEIENAFSTALRVDGKTYDFIHDEEESKKFAKKNYSRAVFVNDRDRLEFIDEDSAEELQAAGEQALYFDRAGNLVFVSGDVANVARNTKTSIVLENITFDERFGDTAAQFETIDQDGNEKLYQLTLDNLNKITVNGVEHDIKKNPKNDEWKVTKVGSDIVLVSGGNAADVVIPGGNAAGTVVNFKLDDNDNVRELEFFAGNVSGKEGSGTTTAVVEASDRYVGGKRLTDDTVVFDAKRGFNANGTTNGIDEKDVRVTTWGEYNGSDINRSYYVYNDDNEVIALVIVSTAASDITEEAAVITNVLRNSDREIVEITAFIDGAKETFKVDEHRNDDIVRGGFAILEFDKDNADIVDKVLNSTTEYFDTNKTVKDGGVDSGRREVTFTDGTTARLISGGLILDISDPTDVKTKAWSDLRSSDINVTVVYDEKNSSFAKYFVYSNKPVTAPEEPEEGLEVRDDLDPQDLVGTEFTFSASDLVSGEGNLSFVAGSAESSNPDVATVAIEEDGTLVVKAVDATEATEVTVTVDVTDGEDTVTVNLVVTVEAEEDEEEVVEGDTVADVGGQVREGLLGTHIVEITLDNLEEATADSTVTLEVDGKDDVTLTFNEDRQSFWNISIQGYTEEELKNAVVKVN